MPTEIRRRPTPKRWPKGTWMKLKSPELLRAFVGPEESKRISGRRLARAIGCHPSFVDHLLSGRKRSCAPVTAQRIAEALDIPLEILFDPSIPLVKRRSDAPQAA